MSLTERHQKLHRCLHVNLIMLWECVLAYHPDEFGADIAQPLEWPGKSFIIDIAVSETTPAGRLVKIDVATARRHVNAPIPVFYLINVKDWVDDELDALGFGGGRPPFVSAVALCGARDVLERIGEPRPDGAAEVDLDTLPLASWEDFMTSLVMAPVAEGPLVRLAAVKPMQDSWFDVPAVASKFADHGKSDPRLRMQMRDDGEEVAIPFASEVARKPPKLPLYNYVIGSEGYRVRETSELKEELRLYAKSVEAGRVDGPERDGITVITVPWKSQNTFARQQLRGSR